MFYVYALCAVISYAFSAFFCRKGGSKSGKGQLLLIVIITGIIMGIFGALYMTAKDVFFRPLYAAKYMPAAIFYIIGTALSIINTKNGKKKNAVLVLRGIFYGLGLLGDILLLRGIPFSLSRDALLLSHFFTFFVCAALMLFYVKGIKKEDISLKGQNRSVLSAVFRTAGQFLYIMAVSAI